MADDRSFDDKPEWQTDGKSGQPPDFKTPWPLPGLPQLDDRGLRLDLDYLITAESNLVLSGEVAKLKKEEMPSAERMLEHLKEKYLPQTTADWKEGNIRLKVAPGLSREKLEAALTALADYFRACGGIGVEFDVQAEEGH